MGSLGQEPSTTEGKEPECIESANLSMIQEEDNNTSLIVTENVTKKTKVCMVSEEVDEEEGSVSTIATTEGQHDMEQDLEDLQDYMIDDEEEEEEVDESIMSMMDDTLLQDADGVITFALTLQQRLQELNEIFDSFSGELSLQNFWALYVETYVEPVGWKALLKPRQDVHDLNCSNHSHSSHEIEPVEVVQVNCSTLDAQVRRENDDNIFEVSLVELYPLLKQDNSFLAMKLTAKCIDNYRFFVNHLYLPWDSEDAKHWCDKHLESRIQLYHDLQSGVISQQLTQEITDLIHEAKRNQMKIDKLEDQLEYTDCDADVDENVVVQLLPLHTRQDEINLRLQKLENPLWRNVLGTLNQAKKLSRARFSEKVILVAENFTCSELTSDLQFIKNQVGEDEKISIVHNLQDALELCQPDVKIFIKPGIHAISGLCNLEEGGSIIGIPGTGDLYSSVIETKDAGDVWLVASTESSVSLENVKIRVGPMYTPPLTIDDNDSLLPDRQAACYLTILVQRGSLNLKNVILEGFTEGGIVGCDDIETNGIKIIGNGNVSMIHCQIMRFVTGIVVREQTKLNMIESVIENCVVGIEASSDAQVQLSQVKIMRCFKFGLKISSNVDETTVGSTELLQTLPNFITSEITFQDCVATNVCIFRTATRLSSGNPEPIPEPPVLSEEADKQKV